MEKIAQSAPSNGILDKFLEIIQHWSYFTIYTGIAFVIIHETNVPIAVKIILCYFIISYFILLLRYSLAGFIVASKNSTRIENLIVGATAISLPLIVIILTIIYIKSLL